MRVHLRRSALSVPMLVASVAAACTPARNPGSLDGPPGAAVTSSASTLAKTSAASPARARCALVPLQLAIRTPGQQPVRMLTLGAEGRVEVTTIGGSPLVARLDPRGCLVGPDGLWAELTTAGKLWTPHEVLDTVGPAIQLPMGATLRITPNGTVERVEKDGRVEPNAYGAIQLEGYQEHAECAGLLLLGAFLSMMPSMAVVDGHPAMAPPPEDSLCNDFRRSSLAPAPSSSASPPAEVPSFVPEPATPPTTSSQGTAGGTRGREIGCSSGGAVAAAYSPRIVPRRTPPKLRASDLHCSFPTGPLTTGIDRACVSLRVRVDAHGQVLDAKLLADPGHGFGEAARTCVLQNAKFDPGTDESGHPTETEEKIRVVFNR